MPLLSIITAIGPADVAFVSDLIASVQAQTLTDWELLLAEDGPSEAARDFTRTDARISWANSPTRGGPAAARNLASARVRSPLWRNLDADDRLYGPDVLAATVAAFAADDVAYVVGPVVDVLPDGEMVHVASPLPAGRIAPGELRRGWRERGHVGLVHPTSLAVRTQVFRAYGGYPALASSEDTALLLRLSDVETGVLLAEPVTLYRKRPGSITASVAHGDAAATAARVAFVESLELPTPQRDPGRSCTP